MVIAAIARSRIRHMATPNGRETTSRGYRWRPSTGSSSTRRTKLSSGVLASVHEPDWKKTRMSPSCP